jgi:biotin---protein ligase
MSSSGTRTNTVDPAGRFDPNNLAPQPQLPDYGRLVKQLQDGEEHRTKFLRACLAKLGLEVNSENAGIPTLTPLHITSMYLDEAQELFHTWNDVISKEGNDEFIRAENDTFEILRPAFSPAAQFASLTVRDAEPSKEGDIKRLVLHESRPGRVSSFSFTEFYSSIENYRSITGDLGSPEATDWGNTLMYGEVVTSTNTMLEK